MANTKLHCSVDYHRFNGANLDTKAHLVSTGIYGNAPIFASPPLIKTAFEALVADHHDKYEAYKNGGKAQKGPYAISRTALIKAMDDTGDFVDALPGVDNDMILLAGYTPTKTGETQTVPPPVPTGVLLSLGVTGEMFGECGSITGDVFYGCILIAGQPLPEGFAINNAGQVIIMNNNGGGAGAPGKPSGVMLVLDLNKTRKKHFTGLTKGVEYYVYFFAVNNAGVSQLSQVVVLMCG